MKYRILTTRKSRWGEGWQYGDQVDLDFEAARIPLLQNEIEPVTEFRENIVIDEFQEPKTVERQFVCDICEKVCKNQLGLAAHRRSHK